MDNIIKCTNCGMVNKANVKYCVQCGYELPRPVVEVDNKEEKLSNEVPKKGNQRKLLGVIAGIITFAIAYWGVQQLFFRPPSLDKIMVREARALNKNCPVMVDQYTRLDNVLAMPPKSFQYNYTLVNLTKAEVNLDTVKKYIEPGILNNVRTNPGMKSLRENKITLIYYYRDKDGNFVYKLTVTPDMYR